MTANHDRIQSVALGHNPSAPQADVDQETRKMLNKNKEDIEKSSKLIWVTISVAILGIILIIIAWITLAMTVNVPDTVIPEEGSQNSTVDNEVQKQLELLDTNIKELNKTIIGSRKNLTDFGDQLDQEKEDIARKYNETKKELEDLKRDQKHLNEELNKSKNIFQDIYENEKCGKTSKTTGKVGKLDCDKSNCHCYGDICLVNKLADDKCSEGSVYRSGTPVCNKSAWGQRGADVVCKALGFNGQQSFRKDSKSDTGEHYKTNCQGYEAKISDCSEIGKNRDECNPNELAYVNCKTIPKP